MKPPETNDPSDAVSPGLGGISRPADQ